MIGRRAVILGGAVALAGLAVPALAQSPDVTKLRDGLMDRRGGEGWSVLYQETPIK